jgi:hypothetical protein
MSLGLMQQIDFNEFHRVELLKYLNDGRGAKAAVSMAADRSLTFVVGDDAWTYRSTGDDIEVVEGRASGLTISLAGDAFSDFVNEMWSVFGLLYGERLTLETGSFEHLVAWEPVLQALWFDRPIYAATESSEFVGRNGTPLSLHQSFTLDDDADEMAHFLQTCGFLVLRNVFSAEEIAAMNEVVERERQRSTPDDKRSWWATDSDGNEVCCRVTYLAERDEVFADLAADERLKDIAALSGAQLQSCPDRLDGLGVVIKNPGVVEGLSDLPWHRDCGMGGHFVLCPGLNVGVQLDEASAENGQLWFLAGSHHHAAQSLDMSQTNGLPTVAVDAQPGDVTVHFGHVMHAAPPPLSPTANRKAVYVGFHVPELFDVIGPGQAYNDVLFTHGDGRVRSVEEASTGN